MGVDIHSYIECDFQNSKPPFTTPDSVRCMNTGEFFVWRDFDLFHALGLDYHDLDIPRSPLVLGRIPDCLSNTLVEKEALIASPFVEEKTDAGEIMRFPLSELLGWQEQELQWLEIKNHPYYNIQLQEGETLLFDPGCELPNYATAEELRSALEECGIQGEKVDYFRAVVAMMDSFSETLSMQHVRLVYWFDFLSGDFMRKYKTRHNIANNWPNTAQ